MADLQSTQRIEELRTSLGEKLEELHRRAKHTKAILSPSTYWQNPWVRVGIGFALGWFVARMLTRRGGE
ncbi:MAG: hypothetical protein ABI867_42335 [Kofleriaceae bacterium]